MPCKFLWVIVLINVYLVNYISCEDGISLAFAIDDTRSMWDDIKQVKREAKNIMNMVLTTKSSEVKDFVLVTINDPDVLLRTKTRSPSTFLDYLNRTKIHNIGNYDCAERTLAGIEKALIFSRPESYIYVFTDASTKELHKLKSITTLCQKKQSQVVFVLTGDCREPHSRSYTVYYEVARACSGQVFRVKKDEVHTVLKTIEILLKGKNSIFKWQKIPKTPKFVPVAFTLDEKAEYAIVSTSGHNVKLRVTTKYDLGSTEPASDKIMWNDNGKVVKLVNLKPGTYYAWVKGSSTISVVIYVRTDFTFGYGFSVLEPKSMRDTVKQPIAGLGQHLSINVTDPNQSVDIKSAQILDIRNDTIIKELPLKKIGGNIYITESFVSPNNTFKIAVTGKIKKTHETIIRNSRHIDPQIIVDLIQESKPLIKIDEGLKLDVNYGSGVSLTCKVKAHPAPKIEWYSSSGVLLPSNSSVLEDPLFVSYLKLNNIKQNETYVCKASNKKGRGRDITIQVSVRPVFTLKRSFSKAVYNAMYGEDVKIPCNIKSYLPIKIKWFRSGKELSDNSGKHSISSDGSELTLKSMDIGMQDKYTCEATLNSDPAVKQTNDIQIKIAGLARPEIKSTNSKISVIKGDKIELNCKIARGYPKPLVKWFKEKGNGNIPITDVTSEVLTVNQALFKHAGQYKCEAINVMGIDTATFDVTIYHMPVITISGATKELPYDSNTELMCNVESYPPPTILWKDNKGSVLQREVIKVSETEFVSQLKLGNLRRNAVYTCLASNNIGSTNDYVKVKVSLPFEVKTHMKEVVGISYGREETLRCDIKSAKPMAIRWYREKIGVKSSRSAISSSGKYIISGDGTKLTIKSMDMAIAGKYICEASLLSIPTEKIVFGTTVNVVGLISPEVVNSTTVFNEKNFTAICRIRGVPSPIISWQFKPKGSKEFSSIPGSGEVLNIPELRLKHTGVYKCIAKNELGSTERDLNVVVEDLIPKFKPEVAIDEGLKLDVNYGSGVSLTCKVRAHPAPKIEWYSSSGALLPSSSSVLEDTLFVSYLKVNNIEQSETYVCTTSNKQGQGRDTAIKVSVRPVFTPERPALEAVYNAMYGEDVKIPCNIKSYLPIKIKWFRSGKELSHNSGKHSISSDGSELTLKSMDIGMQDKYTCEATLNSDPAVKQTNDIRIKIAGLARPEIKSTNSKISVIKGDKIELNCKIVRGYPKPLVKWFKEKGNGNIPITDVTSEVLTVNQALFQHAGQYKCEAINVMGIDTATFEVIISSMPVITISGATKELPYDSNAEFTCNVASYPPPRILWKDNKGSVLQREVIKISETEFVSQLKLDNLRRSAVYTCLANNNIGSTNDFVNVKVSLPFEVKTHMKEVVGISYGSEETLRCDIKSEKPMAIRWYREKIGVKSSRSAISSSDKYIISGDGTKLTIKSMDMAMAGKYNCEASLLSVPTEKKGFSTTVNVVGLIGPEVVNSTTTLYEKNFTAICRIRGVPRPIISWQFKPNGSKEFSPIPGSGEELNIPELRLKHTGVYKCIAQNELGSTERDLNVVVEEQPVITNEETNYYGVEGDLVMKIPCDVIGFPEPTVVWKKGGIALNTDSKYLIIGNTLFINNPVQSDSEEYTCEANNSLGNATKAFVVNVVGNFEGDENFTGDSHDIHAEQGKSKTLKCNLENPVDGSVRWYMEGLLTKETESNYTIEKASISDEGNYTCRVNTNEGSKSETYVLYVGYPPIFEDNSPSPVTIDWQEGHQMLDCAADSQPPAQYQWLHNGKTETGHNFHQRPITDWGTFTCHVSNVHGNISKTFKVFTSGCYITNNVQNQPLVSEINTPTWPPSLGNSDIFLKENEEIKLSCPNNTKSANTFKTLPSKREIIAKCNAEDKFIVDGKTHRYSDLQCNNKVEPSVLATREQCSGPKSEMIRVGFEVNGFLDAYKVCFDRNLNVPLYASISTYVPRAGDGVNSTNFKWSSTPELGNRVKDLKTEDWKPEGSCECCYTKGQLVNVNELAFGPAQAATFKYNLNSIPIWNPKCDDSSRTSWQDFDNEIRGMSLYNKWSTCTGVSEWGPTSVGLVPKFIWKVLNYDEGSTVMVYVNDKYPVESDIRCSRPCESMMEADKFLYCCTPEEFNEKFGVSLDKIKVA